MLQLYASVSNVFRKYVARDQRGVTAIEYGLIAGLIAALLVTVLQATGNDLVAIFTRIQQAIATAAAS